MNSLIDALDILGEGGNHHVDDDHQNGIDYDNSGDFDPDEEDDDDEDVPQQPGAKKSRKEEIQWTEQKEYVLVCTYKAEKAYMKGRKGELKMALKRLIVYNKIKEHSSFKDDVHVLTAGGVSAKFGRMWKAIGKKYSLTGEGANLSGLPENAPRVDAALYNMIKEKHMNTVQVSKGKQKEVDRNNRLNKHRDTMLASMVRDHAINPSLVPAPPTNQGK